MNEQPTLYLVPDPDDLPVCPLCGHAGHINPYMVEIACDVKGIEFTTMRGLSYAELSNDLEHPACWFHQEGERPEPMPWEMVVCQHCNGEGYVSPLIDQDAATPPSTLDQGQSQDASAEKDGTG